VVVLLNFQSRFGRDPRTAKPADAAAQTGRRQLFCFRLKRGVLQANTRARRTRKPELGRLSAILWQHRACGLNKPLARTNCRFACPCWVRAAKHQLATKQFSSATFPQTHHIGTGRTSSALERTSRADWSRRGARSSPKFYRKRSIPFTQLASPAETKVRPFVHAVAKTVQNLGVTLLIVRNLKGSSFAVKARPQSEPARAKPSLPRPRSPL